MMASDVGSNRELFQLLAALADEQLSESQEERLADILREDPEARTCYLDYVALHTSLHWSYAEAATAPTEPILPIPTSRPVSRRVWTTVLTASVLLMAAAWLALQPAERNVPGKLATLVSSKNAQWDSGALPTEDGASLGPGRLRLTQGLAEIRFESGAVIVLEGPADLELNSTNRCTLSAGRLVANVPESATGFTVETPVAVVRDLGTEFGVYVGGQESVEVSVFDGKVDVKHQPTGSVKSMQAGDNVRFTRTEIMSFVPETVGTTENRPDADDEAETIFITTGQSRGADAYVESMPARSGQFRSTTLLYVKNSRRVIRRPPNNRKAYLRFDLSSIDQTRIADAELVLTAAASGIGFASEVPDATFVVYGLTDETEDEWKNDMTWETAPARKLRGRLRFDGAAIDERKVVRLGTFVIRQGETRGRFGVKGENLRDFLRRDTNGLATLIVIRETLGSGKNDLVHAFASHRHPELSPPTLRLALKKE